MNERDNNIIIMSDGRHSYTLAAIRGSIRAESDGPGSGTAFHLRIPVDRPPAGAHHSGARGPHPPCDRPADPGRRSGDENDLMA